MMKEKTDKWLARALQCGALALCFALSGCGSGTPPRVAVFALDGPPLALAAAQGEVELLEEAAGGAVSEATESGGFGGGSAPAPAAPLYRIVNEIRFTGEMERGLLAGIGRFKLANPETGLICEGNVDSAPSRRGRIRGIVPCGEGEFFMFTLSHQGPDQGAGVGRFASGQGSAEEPESLELETLPGPPVLFFYHPWAEEAERRLTDMQKNLAAHLKDGRKKAQREE